MKNVLALSALALLLSFGTAHAQTITAAPNTMNFQGRLAKPDGTPVPDGVHTVTFRIYAVLTGGTATWTEAISLTTKNGSFSAVLGKTTPFTDAILNGIAYLEIQVDSDAPLTPRQQFQSVAYALKANTVPDGSISTVKIANGAVTAAKIASGVVPTALPPNGAAGGDLTGAYPNPLLATLFSSLSKVSGGLLAAQPYGTEVVDQRQETSSFNCGGAGLWQSFTAGFTGTLTALDINLRSNTAPSYAVTLFIYIGEGRNTLLTKQPIIVVGNTYTFQHFTLVTPVALAAGQKYTWDLEEANIGTNVRVQAQGDVYSGGTSNCNPFGTIDFAFRTYMQGQSAFVSSNLSVNGNISASGTVSANSVILSSDARYKTNIATLNNALDNILNLRGVTYDFDREKWPAKNFSDSQQIGFIAQELEKIFPELVQTDKDGYKSVNYIGIVPVLVEAIKAQQQKIDAQGKQLAEIAELKAQLAALTASLHELKAAQDKVKTAAKQH